MRDRWPEGADEFMNLMYGTLRKTDDEIERVFGKKPIQITGKAGARFLVDTSGVHKGPPPQGSDRLICQVLYGVTPYFHQSIWPSSMGDAVTRHIPEWLLQPPLDYVNRLFLKAA